MTSWKKTVAIAAALAAAYFLGRFFAPPSASLPPHEEPDSLLETSNSPNLHHDKQEESLRQLREENDALRRALDGLRKPESSITANHSTDAHGKDVGSVDGPLPGAPKNEMAAEAGEPPVDAVTVDSPPTGKDGLDTLEEVKRELKAMPAGTTTDWPEPKRRSFLARMTLRDPLKTIDKMARVDPVKDRYIETLYGGYRGPIRFIAKQKPGRVRLDIREFDAEQSGRWLVLIEVTDARGKKSRETGGLDMLRSLDPKSSGYAIRSSETSFLQLFYREAEQRFIGNYYEKTKKSTYVRLGTVELNRVQDL